MIDQSACDAMIPWTWLQKMTIQQSETSNNKS